MATGAQGLRFCWARLRGSRVPAPGAWWQRASGRRKEGADQRPTPESQPITHTRGGAIDCGHVIRRGALFH